MPEPARSAGAPRYRAAGGSDTGRLRTGNEDRLYIDERRGVFAVVDGVGGHAAGEVAAGIAVDVIAQRLERPLWSGEARVLREAIALANNDILKQAEASPEHAGMTCVLTVALLTERGLTVGHVGDTRLYKLTASGMVKLTHDHSPVGEREDAREISEVEAMRHPRRNEVFRDVGSSFHEPEDPEFVEIVEDPFDDQSAMLICSDGLSDMVSSKSIERAIRRYAGDPHRVVEALIAAANEAGGKDNITVVYVEGEGFADAVRAAAVDADRSAAAPLQPESVPGEFWKSRTTWLSLGLMAGLGLGLTLAWMLAWYAPLPSASGRTLIVGGVLPDTSGSDRFSSIDAAMKAASPRDTVQLEPGTYEEAVIVKDGVNLDARLPGSVVLTAPSGRAPWIAVTADGRLGNRISGLTIRGRQDAPLSVGLRLTGHDLLVDDVTVEGVVGVGADIVNDGNVVVRGSRFADIEGLPLRIGSGARPIVRQNFFVHAAGARRPAAEIASDATPELRGNLFAGYAEIEAAHGPPRLLDGNFVIRPDRPPVPRRRVP